MKKKVLFVATVVKGHIDVFHIPYLKMFKDMGWETSVFANNNYKNKSDCVIPYCDNYYNAPFTRNPLSIGNVKSYKLLKKLIEDNNYDIIHCHTPVGGAITRLAAKNLKSKKTKVYYTAHGFHFFKGAPLKNWLAYYPIEKYLSKYTDNLIVMNEEDYNLAIRKKLGNKIELVPGVGVDDNKFLPISDVGKYEIKKQLGFETEKIVITYIGELSKRKNQEFLINSIAEYKNIKEIQLVLVGTGSLEERFKKNVMEKKLEDSILFLGYRQDIDDILSATDIVVSTSYQEGLPVNIMEGMASGKPIIVSDCRGNRDLVTNNVNGFVYRKDDKEDFLNKLDKLVNSYELRKSFGSTNRNLSSKYSKKNISSKMEDIYCFF